MVRALLASLLLITSSGVYGGEKITVYAASSLTNVMNALIAEYPSSDTVIPVYAGTSTLTRQIERGAPADVFIAANQRWMHYLEARLNLQGDTVTNIAANRLVLIAPNTGYVDPISLELIGNVDVGNENVSSLDWWKRSLNTQRLAIGNPTSVPAGIYAKQALSSLGVWDQVSQQLAPTKSVRSALVLVERGEAPLGIVYRTDALLSDKVNILYEFEPNQHKPIRYPMAVLSDKSQAKSFADFINSDEAKAIFKQHGFLVEGN